MPLTRKLPFPRKILFAVVGAALLTVAGVGVAFAAGASESSGPGNPVEQDFIDKLAAQLGVSTDTLTADIRSADLAQIDDWLSSGKITQAQADSLKQRINAAGVPPLGANPYSRADRFFGPGIGNLSDLAQFLGTDTQTLQTDLKSGQSLAQIAQANGKTADQLTTFLVDNAEQQLKDAVAAGKLTQAQADSIQSQLQDRISQMIQQTHTARSGGMGFGGSKAPGGQSTQGGTSSSSTQPMPAGGI